MVGFWHVALALAPVGLLLGGWAFLVEPRLLRIRHVTLALSRWPADGPTLRVGVIADLHVGAPYVTIERLREIVAQMNAEAPDLVLLPGDFVNEGCLGGRFVAPELVAKVLAELRAPLGVHAVIGNHDLSVADGRVASALEEAGITVLENRAVKIAVGNHAFWLMGVGDDRTGHADPGRALAGVADDLPVLALAHDPASFLDMPDRVALTVCGHTHGGQVYFPLVGALIMPSRAPRRWAFGHIRELGRDLYVSAGVGTSSLPLRFNMPPEIAVLSIGAA